MMSEQDIIFNSDDGKTYAAPKSITPREMAFLIAKESLGGRNLFGMEDVGYLRSMGRALTSWATIDVPMGGAGLVQEISREAQKPISTQLSGVGEAVKTFAVDPVNIGGTFKATADAFEDPKSLLDFTKDYSKIPVFGNLNALATSLVRTGAATGAKLIGPEMLEAWSTKKIAELQRKAEEAAKERPEDPYEGFVYDLSKGGASLFSAIALTLATRNAGTAAVVFGGYQKGHKYIEGMDALGDHDKASRFSTAAGVAEGGLEMIGVSSLLKAFKGTSFFKSVVRSMLTEGAQEGSQSAAENILSVGAGVQKFNPKEMIEDVAYSSFLGLILGGGSTAIAQPVMKKYGDYLTEKKINEIADNVAKQWADQKITAEDLVTEVLQNEADPINMDPEARQSGLQVMKDFYAGKPIDISNLDENQIADLNYIVDSVKLTADQFTGLGEIKNIVRSDILADGRFDEEYAEKAAQIVASSVTSLSRAAGMSPKDYWDSLKVQIRRQPTEDQAFVEDLLQRDKKYFESDEFLKASPDEEVFQFKTKWEEKAFYMGRLANLEGELASYENGENPAKEAQIRNYIKKAEAKLDELADVMPDELFQSAFHGSPYRFERFDLSKIGTGEGAQAFGWGIYFAESLGVAKSYSPRDAALEEALQKLYDKAEAQQDYVKVEVIEEAMLNKTPQEIIDRFNDDDFSDEHRKAAKEVAAYVKKNAKGSQAYKVEIPDADIERMLDWDKTLGEQPGMAEKLFGDRVNPDGSPIDLRSYDRLKGAEAYYIVGERKFREKYPGAENSTDDKAASEHLASLGIPGIKYLDGGSRSLGEGTRNFVVFDQALLDKISDSIETLYQKNTDPQGSVLFTEDGRKVITLLEKADASTFMHEMSHIFLREYQRLSQVTKDENFKQDWKKIKEWVGAEQDSDFLTTRQEELFARGFEAYLRRGVAPKPYLEKAFGAFGKWLHDIYKVATDLNVTLNEEITGVFDRLVQADRAIKQGEAKDLNDFLGKESELSQKHEATEEYAKIRNVDTRRTNSERWGIIGNDAVETGSNIFTPVSSRFSEIHPSLRVAARKFVYAQMVGTKNDLLVVEAWLKKTDALSKKHVEDWRELDLALKNSDVGRVDMILQKHNMQKEYKAARKLLDKLWDEAHAAGLDIELLEEYWPRGVDNARAQDFVSYLRGTDGWTSIDIYMKKIDPEGTMDVAERAEAASMFLRGFGMDKVGLARPDILKKRMEIGKKRSIGFITAEMNSFYLDSNTALINYITGMRKAIEVRKFLGVPSTKRKRLADSIVEQMQKIKGIEDELNEEIANAKNEVKKKELTAKRDHIIQKRQKRLEETKNDYLSETPESVEDSIGAYVLKLVEEGVIDHKHEGTMKTLVQALVEAKGPRPWVAFMKNMAYIYTMGDVASAITQIGDLGFAVYKNGVFDTLAGMLVVISRKDRLTREDIGIDNILQEFEDPTKSGEAVKKVFRITGLGAMDGLGKESFLYGAEKRLRRDAKKGDADLLQQMEWAFGEEAGRVRQDLIDGKRTEETNFLAFCELLSVQPAALTEMPVGYLKGGNWRALYMLKTYALKVLDVYRNDVIRDFPKNPLRATRNMIRLSVCLALMGMGADALRDLLFGRTIYLSDLVIENIIKLFGVSRYQISTVKSEGLESFLETVFVPVYFAPYNDLIKDASSEREFADWRTVGKIPLVGRFYYWHFGGGVEKKKREEERKAREEGQQKKQGSGL